VCGEKERKKNPREEASTEVFHVYLERGRVEMGGHVAVRRGGGDGDRLGIGG